MSDPIYIGPIPAVGQRFIYQGPSYKGDVIEIIAILKYYNDIKIKFIKDGILSGTVQLKIGSTNNGFYEYLPGQDKPTEQ